LTNSDRTVVVVEVLLVLFVFPPRFLSVIGNDIASITTTTARNVKLPIIIIFLVLLQRKKILPCNFKEEKTLHTPPFS
jgi:hypothetical protein